MNTEKHAFWKRYYYNYQKSFLAFLTSSDTQGEQSKREYIVLSDVLSKEEDIQSFLQKTKKSLGPTGRIIITEYNALWEPILKLATFLKLRKHEPELNWLSMIDIKNFVYLAGMETIKSGTKMIMPIYIPVVSFILNRYLANIWPFNRLGIFHYLIARKPEPRMSGNPSISIVVPARNEAGTIEKIATELPELGTFTEIIFIEGNSIDNTYEEIKRVANKLGKTRRIVFGKQDGKGKGDAVRKGFDMATGDILTIYDADMTVPAEDMRKFYNAIAENKGDFINGSRLVYPMQKQSMRILNFFGNKFFSLAFSWILGQSLKDTLCGTKVIWKSDYEKVKKGRSFFGDFDPFGDFDLLFGAAKLNLKIIDLPIHYRERIYGATNISRWKHGWLLLRMTIFAARKIKFI